jgi:exosortase
MTGGLKTFVSITSTQILGLTGYPVARIGVTLYVAQFQLLVEDACSGMNSIVSLTSVSLFYIYLLHATSWRYAVFLTCWILPIAIAANILRVLILVLITYHLGNEAAQGFLHNTAGMVMFVVALLGIFAVDRIAAPLFRRRGWM